MYDPKMKILIYSFSSCSKPVCFFLLLLFFLQQSTKDSILKYLAANQIFLVNIDICFMDKKQRDLFQSIFFMFPFFMFWVLYPCKTQA